ncbi:MAG TPA: LLM class flavin-dependent oxidoreductase [Candidatus Bathyarchaeia archaeon]|nr:LLM class flavin-dependent oxidoreductase [Candidatus Bathyarchaeia archaeon]
MVRFAIGLPSGISMEKALDYAKTADKNYYSFLWLRGGYFSPDSLDPLAMLTAIASNTEEICVGPWGSDPQLLHPSLMANYTATLSEVSNGRAVAAVGGVDLNGSGRIGGQIRVPEIALKESFNIVRRLLDGEMVDLEGEIFKAKSTKLFGKPQLTGCHGPNTVPVYVKCESKESLGWAAENANGILVSVPIRYFPIVMEEIKSAADKAGRSLDGFDVANWLPWSVSMDVKEAREFVKPQVAEAVAAASTEVLRNLGINGEEVEKIRNALAKDPIKAKELVTEPMIDDFSISGPYWECNKKVKELVKMGGWPDVRGRSQIVVGYPYGPSGAEAIKTIGNETVIIFKEPYDC